MSEPTSLSGFPYLTGAQADNDGTHQSVLDLGNQRGRKSDVAHIAMGSDLYGAADWSEIRSETNSVVHPTTGKIRDCINSGLTPVVAIPLLMDFDAQRFDKVLAGDYDEFHADIARNIASALESGNKPNQRVYPRLGWRADEGLPWSLEYNSTVSAHIDDYVAAWNRAAQIYIDNIPNAKIEWSIYRQGRLFSGRGMGDYIPTKMHILGLEWFQDGVGTFPDIADDFETGDITGEDPSNEIFGFNGYVNDENQWNLLAGSYDSTTQFIDGIEGLFAKAQELNLKMALPCWGSVNQTALVDESFDSRLADPANNYFFSKRTLDWIWQRRAWIEYEICLNSAKENRIFPPSSSCLPNCSNAYQAWFQARVV